MEMSFKIWMFCRELLSIREASFKSDTLTKFEELLLWNAKYISWVATFEKKLKKRKIQAIIDCTKIIFIKFKSLKFTSAIQNLCSIIFWVNHFIVFV